MDDIKKCSYLEKCIKESLRMFPSVPLIARRLSEDVTISEYFRYLVKLFLRFVIAPLGVSYPIITENGDLMKILGQRKMFDSVRN